jgi:sodium/proline symporter
MTTLLLAFVVVLALSTAVGVASARRAVGTAEDYLVASRSVGPVLTALSSAATNNSGFMFIGLIGYAYAAGVAAVWLQLGWIVGDLIAWLWFHRRLRERSEELGVTSVAGLLGAGARGRGARALVVVGALLTLLFLTVYAAAQLRAGTKALTALSGWDPSVGVLLGAGIVLIYCLSGGIRASIWTDVLQSIVMFGAMAWLAVAGLIALGGPAGLLGALAAADPALVRWIPDDLALGFPAYLLGFVGAGLGVIGQPHILSRTMALRSPAAIPRARRVYFLWYVPFSAAAVVVGLCARVLLPPAAIADPELALPLLSQQLLPEVAVGLLLAGLFSATMSTADSQILACSAALTQDLDPRLGRTRARVKAGTLALTVVAALLALWGPQSVFFLVLVAWTALAVTLGPVLVLRLARAPLSAPLAIVVMLTGFVAAAVWRFVCGLDGDVFELLPGLVAALLAYFGLRGWLSSQRRARRRGGAG